MIETELKKHTSRTSIGACIYVQIILKSPYKIKTIKNTLPNLVYSHTMPKGP